MDSLIAVGALAGAAFLTGLGGSPHCALMCGPLACPRAVDDARARRRAAQVWHLGRLAAYATVGATLGGMGHGVLAVLRGPALRVFPWLMVLGLLLSALEVGRNLPPLPGLGRIPARLARVGARLSPPARAALRGAATPFLPCGLLYGAFVMAMGTGAAWAGFVVMASFALGAVPALTLVQMNARRLSQNPRWGRRLRYAVPLLAAFVVAWRVLHAGSADGAAPPACH